MLPNKRTLPSLGPGLERRTRRTAHAGGVRRACEEGDRRAQCGGEVVVESRLRYAGRTAIPPQ